MGELQVCGIKTERGNIRFVSGNWYVWKYIIQSAGLIYKGKGSRGWANIQTGCVV